jgi:hypothetical protein
MIPNVEIEGGQVMLKISKQKLFITSHGIRVSLK